MSSSSENSSTKKRGFIVLLLMISCAVALYLLWNTAPPPDRTLRSPAQLDSLISETFREFNIGNSQIRLQTIEIDTVFSRKEYTVHVTPEFSKTMFHYHLHERIWPYHAETIGIVKFPEKDMHIHLAYNGTIQRSIILYSESED